MIRDYLLMPCGYPKGSPYNTGDGIKMAQAIGADLWHMDNQAGPDLNFKPPDADWAFGYVFRPPGKGYIWVAKDATRFVDETISTKHGKIPFHGTYVPLPTPLPVHVIFDEAMRKSGPFYSSGGGGMCWYNVIEEYKWSEDSSAELGKGWISKADNIRDLAGKIGKNSDTLERTVATWNRSCESGNDAEFGRPTKQMAPIKTPPTLQWNLCLHSPIHKADLDATKTLKCWIQTISPSRGCIRAGNSGLYIVITTKEVVIYWNVLPLAGLPANTPPRRNPGSNRKGEIMGVIPSGLDIWLDVS